MTSPIAAARIPEIRVPGKPLGRHIAHDQRSRNYELPQAEIAAVITDVEHTSTGLPLNQGQVGSCTANAVASALNCAPSAAGTPRTEDDAIKLYERETADEGMPYPAYDPGGSGLAVCKAAKELGWITRYWHAFHLERALRGLMIRPIMIGSNWYSSFDTPDPSGEVTIGPGAFPRGGHEYTAYKIDAGMQLVWCWNSWGTSYGNGGTFALGYGTLERLLAESGDVTVPVP